FYNLSRFLVLAKVGLTIRLTDTIQRDFPQAIPNPGRIRFQNLPLIVLFIRNSIPFRTKLVLPGVGIRRSYQI
ncbi:MAG: hypothetical protein KAR15_17345, partial [Desulfobacterales bacterium]|nr:hypothetical protein [Desulfobacterales bacterium]